MCLHMGGDRVRRRREFDERQSIGMGQERVHEQPSLDPIIAHSRSSLLPYYFRLSPKGRESQ